MAKLEDVTPDMAPPHNIFDNMGMADSEGAIPTEQATHCHECDRVMERDVRPRTVAYEVRSEVVAMPGWYCECGEAIYSGTDMAVCGDALRRLRAVAAEPKKHKG